jgi:hypothetical protein
LATPNETDGCYYTSTSLLAIVCYMFFSDTLTWQQQQRNIATFVIMTTNLNWRPPGVRHVRISFVPTVTGTMQNLHQTKNTL